MRRVISASSVTGSALTCRRKAAGIWRWTGVAIPAITRRPRRSNLQKYSIPERSENSQSAVPRHQRRSHGRTEVRITLRATPQTGYFQKYSIPERSENSQSAVSRAELFVPQCDHGIDVGGAARGKEAGCERH